MRRSVSVHVVVDSVRVGMVCTILEEASRKGAKAERKEEAVSTRNAHVFYILCAFLRETSVPKQPVHVLLWIKHDEVVDFLSDSRIAYRQVQFFSNGNGDAAFGSSVELR